MEKPHKPLKILPGTLLFDRYRVEVVGRGRPTKARLLQAVDQQSGKKVAIKIQPLDVGQHEAALLERLAHPHLVRFLAHHVVASSSYLVEEWVVGERLGNLRSRCSREQVVQLGNQLADVLEQLHAHRVVHADLDGDNVLLSDGGQVMVVDLGLALEFAPGDPECAFWVNGEISKARELLAVLLERAVPATSKRLLQVQTESLETVRELRAALRDLAD